MFRALSRTFLASQLKRWTDVIEDEKGVILALFALVLPILLVFVALAVNFMGPTRELTRMQMAADAASRAAAMLQVLNITDGTKPQLVQSEGHALAAANKYSNNPPTVTVTVNVPPRYGDNYYKNSGLNAVEVIITKQYAIPFLSDMLHFFGWIEKPLSVRSVAAWNFAPCLVALNTDPNSPDTGITFSGTNTNVTAACGIYSNNLSSTASIVAGGGCSGSGPSVKTFYAGAAGGISAGNSNGICPVDGVSPVIAMNTPVIVDPFAGAFDLTTPTGASHPSAREFGGSTDNDWAGVTDPLTPGIYDSVTFNGSKTITMSPGVYYFTGSLSINGQTVNAPYSSAEMSNPLFAPTDGVTIVMEGGRGPGGISVAAGGSTGTISGNLNLTAPVNGTTAGIGIVNYHTGSVNFNSNNTKVNINGVIYSPNSSVSFNAPVGGLATCLTIVAKGISVAGGGTIGGACPAKTMNLSGFRAAGLVE